MWARNGREQASSSRAVAAVTRWGEERGWTDLMGWDEMDGWMDGEQGLGMNGWPDGFGLASLWFGSGFVG